MWGLQGIGGGGAAFIVVLGAAYLAYLLAISPSRRGRLVLGLVVAVTLVIAYIVSPGAAVVGVVTVGLMWLVRTVLFHADLVSALGDALLCTLSMVCAFGTAVSTHRLWLAVWVFFLFQALFVYLPQRLERSPSRPSHGRSDAFARAHRAAEAALQTMAQRT